MSMLPATPHGRPVVTFQADCGTKRGKRDLRRSSVLKMLAKKHIGAVTATDEGGQVVPSPSTHAEGNRGIGQGP